MNIEGNCFKLAFNESACCDELNLDSLVDMTISNEKDSTGSFVKFKNCRSCLFADDKHLYARLETGNLTYQLV